MQECPAVDFSYTACHMGPEVLGWRLVRTYLSKDTLDVGFSTTSSSGRHIRGSFWRKNGGLLCV